MDHYDGHIDAMKARERKAGIWPDSMTYWVAFKEEERNVKRLAAYKRSKATHELEGTTTYETDNGST